MKAICAVLAVVMVFSSIGKGKNDAPIYDRRANLTYESGTLYENAPYTVRAGDSSYGCYVDDHSVDCQEQKFYSLSKLYLFDFHGVNGEFVFTRQFSRTNVCDPLLEIVSELIRDKVKTYGLTYRYGRFANELFVPCTYRDKHGKQKTSEAGYVVTQV